MTTIPQRLREIAARLRRPRDGRPWGADDGAADLLDAIAAELEAPAADAVPVVAYEFEHTYGKSTFHAEDEFHLAYRDTAKDIHQLIRQRDHLATVAALQARIKELERQKEMDVEQGHVSVAHYASVLRQLSDAQARINALDAAIQSANSVTPWHERVRDLDRPTDFAERWAATQEVAELRRCLAPLLPHPDISKEAP